MNKIFIYNHVIESKCDFNNNQLRNLKKTNAYYAAFIFQQEIVPLPEKEIKVYILHEKEVLAISKIY